MTIVPMGVELDLSRNELSQSAQGGGGNELRDVDPKLFAHVCCQISRTQYTSMKLGDLTASSVYQVNDNHQPWPA